MFDKLLGGGSTDINGLVISRVQNGFIVDVPKDGGGFEDLIKHAIKIQEEAIDPVMAKIKSDEEDNDKLEKLPSQFIFYTFKEVLDFLNYWFEN